MDVKQNTPKKLLEERIENFMEWTKNYNEKNKDKNIQYFNLYYQENKDILKKRSLDFYHKNRKVNFCDLCEKQVINLRVHQYGKKTPEKINWMMIPVKILIKLFLNYFIKQFKNKKYIDYNIMNSLYENQFKMIDEAIKFNRSIKNGVDETERKRINGFIKEQLRLKNELKRKVKREEKQNKKTEKLENYRITKIK